MKKFTKPNFNLCMQDRLTILKMLRDKRVTVMNKNLMIYGALRGNYYMTNYVATKNELKSAIPYEYLYKQPSSNEKISYTLVSMINHDGDSLETMFYVKHFHRVIPGIAR